MPRLARHVAGATAEGNVGMASSIAFLAAVVASADARCRLLPAPNPPYPLAAITRSPAAIMIGQKGTIELACMRIWRRVGDEREAERCNARLNDLLDEMIALRDGAE
jgi:hypothetical protein